MTVNEAVKKALYAYAMEFWCRYTADKSLFPNSEYVLRMRGSADWWLQEARRLRRIAEGGR